MEPANWWVGMKHNQIQLLVYGKDISSLRPSISYEGVTLNSSMLVENPNYLFLDITISDEAKAGEVPVSFTEDGQEVLSRNFSLLDRKEDRQNIEGFNTTDAIYLITPDRFANGKPDNDNIAPLKEQVNRSFKGGRHGGDIEGIRKNIDYIKDLGFTAIWLNPLLENDMEEYSYHGYSTTDYYKVDSRFGTNEEYQAMAEEARAKGVKLIMDMIVNHCGSEHWWMKDLPMRDWVNQWPEYTGTNHRKTVLQDPYVSDIDKKVFTDGWFVPTMPDLNQRNPLMAQYLLQNSIWWVEYLGLSGIRMDTYPYPDEAYMTAWTKGMMIEYPDLNIVGEEWYEWPTIVSYWQKGKANPNGYTSYLRSVMDFPVQAEMSRALTLEESWGSGFIKLYEMVAQDFLYPDPMNLVIFPDNHDMQRIYGQMGEDIDLFNQAIVYVATMRGIPQYYYGTEILMSGSGDHGIVRSDFPGGWDGDKVNAFTGEGLTKKQKEAQAMFKKLLNWRKGAEVIHTGKLRHFIPQNGVYVYFRYTDEQKVMVVLNKLKKGDEMPLERYQEMLEGVTSGTDVLSGEKYELEETLKLSPKQALILELE
ncbi:MAG: glycoside hydrolase family 13 protein [Bacteroidota bacterium]